MVKNSGGNKAKGFARKSFAKSDNTLRISQEEAELYAQVTKIYGGRMCQVITIDGVEMICHIRGKFSGRGKRDNFICNGTWLLVGKREWEKESPTGKLLNCDIIEVYNDGDKNKLKNNITTVNWSRFINNDTKTLGNEEEDGNTGFAFSDEKTQEYQELIEAQIKSSQTGTASIITTDDGEIIDVDDI
jgi:hypothetical protein